jgi:hypothetical protein
MTMFGASLPLASATIAARMASEILNQPLYSTACSQRVPCHGGTGKGVRVISRSSEARIIAVVAESNQILARRCW